MLSMSLAGRESRIDVQAGEPHSDDGELQYLSQNHELATGLLHSCRRGARHLRHLP